MHKMQAAVTDDRGVCLSVSLSVTRLNSTSLCGVIRYSFCQITLASCFLTGVVVIGGSQPKKRQHQPITPIKFNITTALMKHNVRVMPLRQLTTTNR